MSKQTNNTWSCVKDKCLFKSQHHQCDQWSSELQITNQSQISETHSSHVLCYYEKTLTRNKKKTKNIRSFLWYDDHSFSNTWVGRKILQPIHWQEEGDPDVKLKREEIRCRHVTSGQKFVSILWIIKETPAHCSLTSGIVLTTAQYATRHGFNPVPKSSLTMCNKYSQSRWRVWVLRLGGGWKMKTTVCMPLQIHK